MNREQLDEFLREETEKERISRTTGSGEAIYASMRDNAQAREFIERVNSADGTLVSKQDRYAAVPYHAHEWMELAYMYSGSCSILIGDEKIELHRGECILINSFVGHSNSACSEDDILINFLINRKYLNTNFFNRFSDASYISQYFIKSLINDQTANDYLFFKSGESKRLPLFISEFLLEYYNKGSYSKDFLDSYTTLIFLELAGIYKEQAEIDNKSNDITNILHYIEKNYNDCTLESTAAFFHMNPNYLSGYIRKHTGKTFKGLLQEQRLEFAARLLKNTDMSTALVAHEAGYDNVTFFYKKFRENFGCSPAEYRSV